VEEAEIGMLVVETISKIRRAYFVQKRAIKEIDRSDWHGSRRRHCCRHDRGFEIPWHFVACADNFGAHRLGGTRTCSKAGA
jgi:hypothetical protein